MILVEKHAPRGLINDLLTTDHTGKVVCGDVLSF